MTIHTKTEYRISKGGLAALFVLLLLILSAEFFFVRSTFPKTIASTTITDTQVLTTISFSTIISTSLLTTTAVEIVTITYAGPTNVTVAGGAKSNGVGTSATQIMFIDAQDSKKTFTAQIANGQFSIVLPNHHYYNVFIKYTTSAAGVGSGQCTAAALALFSPGQPLNVEWSC